MSDNEMTTQPNPAASGKKGQHMRFRKKPVVIEAWQFTGEVQVIGMCRDHACWIHQQRVGTNYSNHVHTIHNNQAVEVVPGDWILPEPDGIHFYPCKPDIFEATYEPAD